MSPKFPGNLGTCPVALMPPRLKPPWFVGFFLVKCCSTGKPGRENQNIIGINILNTNQHCFQWWVNYLTKSKMVKTHKSINIPATRMKRQPRLAIPRLVHIVPPLSDFLSRRGSGLCRKSSDSGEFIKNGIPQERGDSASEYYKDRLEIGTQSKRWRHKSPCLRLISMSMSTSTSVATGKCEKWSTVSISGSLICFPLLASRFPIRVVPRSASNEVAATWLGNTLSFKLTILSRVEKVENGRGNLYLGQATKCSGELSEMSVNIERTKNTKK